MIINHINLTMTIFFDSTVVIIQYLIRRDESKTVLFRNNYIRYNIYY